jgi:hypothetical protein
MFVLPFGLVRTELGKPRNNKQEKRWKLIGRRQTNQTHVAAEAEAEAAAKQFQDWWLSLNCKDFFRYTFSMQTPFQELLRFVWINSWGRDETLPNRLIRLLNSKWNSAWKFLFHHHFQPGLIKIQQLNKCNSSFLEKPKFMISLAWTPTLHYLYLWFIHCQN